MPANKRKDNQLSAIGSDIGLLREKINKSISFSFKYLQLNNPNFSIDTKETDYFLKVIGRFKDLSPWTIPQLIGNRNKALRCHPVDWNDVCEDCFGIPGEDEIAKEAFQFSISRSSHGRIIGFIIYDTFYVRWFDPEHNLYS